MSMLEKTIELALQKAENNIDERERELIESHIKTAFISYSQSWEGVHTLKETNEDWEWFYNILTEKNLDDILSKLENNYSKRPTIWTKSFIAVIQILQKHREEPEENYFEIKITGRSTMYDEDDLIDLLYKFLKDKAAFKIQ